MKAAVPTAPIDCNKEYDIRAPGEPNYEWTDLDEADMVGLTGFSSPSFSGTTIAADDRVRAVELVQVRRRSGLRGAEQRECVHGAARARRRRRSR